MIRRKIFVILLFVGSLFACTLATTMPEEIGSDVGLLTPSPVSSLASQNTIETMMPASYLSQVNQERLLQLLFTNGGCNLPCFWGMEPGETSWDFAKAFLGTFNTINTDTLWYEDNHTPAYTLPLQFIDSKNRFISTYLVLTVEDQKVQRISAYAETDSGNDLNSYWGHYSVSLLFSQLGPPSQILFDAYMNDLARYPDYNLLLLYQDYKIAFWLSGESRVDNVICPQIRENGDITSLKFSISDPENKLDIYPPDWEFWSLKKDEDFLTTKELFGISQEEFYSQVLYDGVDCFNVMTSP